MPKSKKSKFKHKRYRNPKEIKKNTFKTVPISHTDSKKKWPKGTKAIVGKSKKTDKWVIQSVLIPKKEKKPKKKWVKSDNWEILTSKYKKYPKKARKKQTRSERGLHGAKSKTQVYREEIKKLNHDLNTNRIGLRYYLKQMKSLEKRYG